MIGVRFYFTTTTVRAPLDRPNKLQLVHVRLPPGYAPSATSQRPSQVHAAFYRQGIFKGFFSFRLQCTVKNKMEMYRLTCLTTCTLILDLSESKVNMTVWIL